MPGAHFERSSLLKNANMGTANPAIVNKNRKTKNMHGLSEIRRMNNKAVAAYKRGAAESETSRHCSYAGTPEDGIVLHSAKNRSCAFIQGRKAVKFMAEWLSSNSAEKHDSLVESYFAHSPRV
jgi:hypothetical protein